MPLDSALVDAMVLWTRLVFRDALWSIACPHRDRRINNQSPIGARSIPIALTRERACATQLRPRRPRRVEWPPYRQSRYFKVPSHAIQSLLFEPSREKWRVSPQRALLWSLLAVCSEDLTPVVTRHHRRESAHALCRRRSTSRVSAWQFLSFSIFPTLEALPHDNHDTQATTKQETRPRGDKPRC